MKFNILATLTLVASLFFTGSAVAENPDQVQQLLSTGECQGCDLTGADLSGAHLLGADLRNANLQGANLIEANLEGADLTGANLNGANLTQAFVTNASLNCANLNQVNLTAAKLYDTDVSGAVMNNMTLTNAEIFETGIGIGGSAEEFNFNVECRVDSALPYLWFKTYQRAQNRQSTWLELRELRDISLPYHHKAGRPVDS